MIQFATSNKKVAEVSKKGTVIAKKAGTAKIKVDEGIASPMRYKYENGLTKNKRYADSLWNDGTIAAMIVNPVYIGDMEQGMHKEAMHMGIKKHTVKKEDRIYVSGTHEPVVSRELFDRVQKS